MAITSRKSRAAALGISIFALSTASCGKNVDVSSILPGNGNGAPNGPGNTVLSCSTDDIVRWRFTQPQPTRNGSADLLFVVDTSESLSEERAKLAAALPAFVAGLDRQIDYRIAVMLAHGGASKHSGRLYSPSGVAKVLSSSTMQPSAIQSNLQQMLSKTVGDSDEANGELMMYSLLKSFEASRLAAIKSQGFYRDGAALSVVFVSDENDGCYAPEKHGYTAFPDFVPSIGGIESVAYNRYCGDVTPESVLSGLRSLKGTAPFLVSTVTHIVPSQVPSGWEDAIGHGQLELVRQSLDGIELEISAYDYAAGIGKMASLVSTSLSLLTAFKLDHAMGLIAETLVTAVDGVQIPSQFEAASSTVRIAPSQAGRAGSVVEIAACRQ